MVTTIPNVTNWSVTPQNGQANYFTLMNTWLSESTSVIASLQAAITAQNAANGEVNSLAEQTATNAQDAQDARDEAVTALALLSNGAIDDTTIATNKAFSNSYIQGNYHDKTETYNKTEINTRLNQLFIKPFSKSRLPLFTKESPSSFIIPLGTRIQIDNAFVELVSNITVSLNTDLLIPENKTAGTDYYVYTKNDGTFYVSSNDSIGTDRLIGGFHYGLTGETEATSGTKTEADMVKLRGINEYSFWDLKYYANCKAGNKGMFIVDNKCYDIYMGDVNYGIDFYSKANAQIAGGGTDNGRGYPKIPLMFGGNGTTNYGKLTPFVAFDLVNAAGKELISYQEFTKIAYGVQEGLAQPETIAGQTGHIGAVTSKYGMEQAIGTQWIWSSSFGTSTSGTWNNIADARGQVYSDVIVAILGGARIEAAGHPGSRCSNWNSGLAASDWNGGFRGCCDLVILD